MPAPLGRRRGVGPRRGGRGCCLVPSQKEAAVARPPGSRRREGALARAGQRRVAPLRAAAPAPSGGRAPSPPARRPARPAPEPAAGPAPRTRGNVGEGFVRKGRFRRRESLGGWCRDLSEPGRRRVPGPLAGAGRAASVLRGGLWRALEISGAPARLLPSFSLGSREEEAGGDERVRGRTRLPAPAARVPPEPPRKGRFPPA